MAKLDRATAGQWGRQASTQEHDSQVHQVLNCHSTRSEAVKLA